MLTPENFASAGALLQMLKQNNWPEVSALTLGNEGRDFTITCKGDLDDHLPALEKKNPYTIVLTVRPGYIPNPTTAPTYVRVVQLSLEVGFCKSEFTFHYADQTELQEKFLRDLHRHAQPMALFKSMPEIVAVLTPATTKH